MQVWVNGDSVENAVALSKFLDQRVGASQADLRAFIIQIKSSDADEEKAKMIAEKSGAQKIGTAFLSVSDPGVKAYKFALSEEVKNTVFVYKNKKVSAKFVNLKADEKGLAQLAEAIAEIEKP
ncbi:hypothetical protein QPK87_20075 [Kamptonema cortianum]|nr:hypothetical protein [Geitlerinema splendidum]MDK3158857.1 hypothetical protein [Kamptonema cortianum]